jgi:HEAT repeat protein
MKVLGIMTALVMLLVVPSVSTAFDYEDNVTDAQGTVIIEGPMTADIPELVELLGRVGSTEAGQAADILIIAGPEAVPALVEALEAGETNENMFIVLGSIADETAIDAIAAYITDDEGVVANNARAALRAYGDAAAPHMLNLLSDSESQEAAIDILAGILPSNESLKLTRELLGSDNSLKRGGAAYLLGNWKDVESEDEIAALFADKDDDVRRMAFEGYYQLHLDNPGGYDTEKVIPMLSDSVIDIKLTATRILRSNRDPKAGDALLKALKKDPDTTVRKYVIDALAEIGEDRAVMPCIEIVSDENSDQWLMRTAVYYLGQLKARESVPFIMEMLMRDNVEDNSRLQAEAFMALLAIGEPVDLAPLMKFLKHGSVHETSTPKLIPLIEAMAKPGDEAAVKKLEDYKEGVDNPDLVERIDRILDRIKLL